MSAVRHIDHTRAITLVMSEHYQFGYAVVDTQYRLTFLVEFEERHKTSAQGKTVHEPEQRDREDVVRQTWYAKCQRVKHMMMPATIGTEE